MRLLLLFAVFGVACDAGTEGGPSNVEDLGAWPSDCINTLPTVEDLCASPALPDELRTSGLHTEDFGRTWWRELPPGSAGTAFDLSDGTPCAAGANGRVYQYGQGLLYRSDDGGREWRRLPAPIAVEYLHASAGLRGFDHRVVLWEFSAVHLSTDAGETWTALSALPSTKTPRSVAPGRNRRLAADFWDDGVFLSRDDGATWERNDVVPSAEVAVAPDGDLWLMRSEGQGVRFLLSRDWGSTWTAGSPVSGEFSWLPDRPDATAPATIHRFFPLGGGVLAWSSVHPDPPTGRADVLCFTGPDTGTRVPDLPDLPSPPPASFPPASFEPVLWGGGPLGTVGKLAVDAAGRLYSGAGPKLYRDDGEAVLHAFRPDWLRESCGGNPLGIDLAVRDVSFDPATGEVLVLADPPTYFPDDVIFAGGGDAGSCAVPELLPYGPILYRYSPSTGEAPFDVAGFFPCGDPPNVNPVAKCDNGACDATDRFACPAECGQDLCGNGACDDWEVLYCAVDCPGGLGGFCGDLACTEQVTELGVCPYDCPPYTPSCSFVTELPSSGLANDADWVEVRHVLPPHWIASGAGIWKLPANGSEGPVLHPADLVAKDPASDDFFLYRYTEPWIRRMPPGASDPCAVPDPHESSFCYPVPDGGEIDALAASAEGHLYAVQRGKGRLLRRPVDAESAPWEEVVVALLNPVDVFVRDTPDGAFVYVQDVDFWVVRPAGATLPLVRKL